MILQDISRRLLKYFLYFMILYQSLLYMTINFKFQYNTLTFINISNIDLLTSIVHWPIITAFKNLLTSTLHSFVTVEGTVVRVSAIKPMVQQVVFMCLECKSMIFLRLKDGIMKYPGKCDSEHCLKKNFKKSKFQIQRNHHDTKTVSFQTIKLDLF